MSKVKVLCAELICAIAAEHKDKLSLDLVAPFDIKVEQVMGEVSIRIVVQGLRIKDRNDAEAMQP